MAYAKYQLSFQGSGIWLRPIRKAPTVSPLLVGSQGPESINRSPGWGHTPMAWGWEASWVAPLGGVPGSWCLVPWMSPHTPLLGSLSITDQSHECSQWIIKPGGRCEYSHLIKHSGRWLLPALSPFEYRNGDTIVFYTRLPATSTARHLLGVWDNPMLPMFRPYLRSLSMRLCLSLRWDRPPCGPLWVCSPRVAWDDSADCQAPCATVEPSPTFWISPRALRSTFVSNWRILLRFLLFMACLHSASSLQKKEKVVF